MLRSLTMATRQRRRALVGGLIRELDKGSTHPFPFASRFGIRRAPAARSMPLVGSWDSQNSRSGWYGARRGETAGVRVMRVDEDGLDLVQVEGLRHDVEGAKAARTRRGLLRSVSRHHDDSAARRLSAN